MPTGRRAAPQRRELELEREPTPEPTPERVPAPVPALPPTAHRPLPTAYRPASAVSGARVPTAVWLQLPAPELARQCRPRNQLIAGIASRTGEGKGTRVGCASRCCHHEIFLLSSAPLAASSTYWHLAKPSPSSSTSAPNSPVLTLHASAISLRQPKKESKEIRPNLLSQCLSIRLHGSQSCPSTPQTRFPSATSYSMSSTTASHTAIRARPLSAV